MRVSWQLREHYPLQKLPVNMYVLKRGAFVRVFETIYTFNFILEMIMITQIIKVMITFHWSKFFGNFSFFSSFTILVPWCRQTIRLIYLKLRDGNTLLWIYLKQKSVFLTDFRFQFSSIQYSRSVMSDSLRPHESQHARPPCPSPTPGVHSDSRPSKQ